MTDGHCGNRQNALWWRRPTPLPPYPSPENLCQRALLMCSDLFVDQVSRVSPLPSYNNNNNYVLLDAEHKDISPYMQ